MPLKRTTTDSRKFWEGGVLNDRFYFQNISDFQGFNGTIECQWKHLKLNYFNIPVHCIQKESLELGSKEKSIQVKEVISIMMQNP